MGIRLVNNCGVAFAMPSVTLPDGVAAPFEGRVFLLLINQSILRTNVPVKEFSN